VQDADIRVLLMMRFNPPGDLKWFGPNYRPQGDVWLIADEDAGLSSRMRAQICEIRGPAFDLLGSKSARSDEMGMRSSGSLKA
jgi:hypothetical protein